MAPSPDVARAVELLRRGALIGLPTETVYGLGADASNELAVRSIFALKGRPSTHPLIVHVADVDRARAWSAGFSREAELLAAAFWPGPLTLIVRRGALASDAVTGGQDTVGLRVPSHPLALEVLREFKGGIAAPSANRFGRVSPTTAAHVRAEFGDELELVLDGGPSSVGVESSIVDVSGPSPRLLRPGGIAKEALERVLGQPLALATHATDVRAPGLLESHYAPRAGVSLVTADELRAAAAKHPEKRLVIIAPARAPRVEGAVHLDVPADADGFARVLYAKLREADSLGELIFAVPPSESGLGLAVRDRLERAAAPRR